MIRSIVKISFVVIMISAFSCTSTPEKTKNQSLVGNWDVQWITYPEEGMEADPTINLTMNGKMYIYQDSISVHAYGYEGCIFGADTLMHTLNWSVSGDTLNLINVGDDFGIPYVIKEISTDKVKLQLVEDVFLFLKREE